MDPAIRAAAERRFAREALEDEREWQRRQQALYAQQAARPAAAPVLSTVETYYPHTYAPYYRAGYYYPVSYARGPYYGRVVSRVPPRVDHHSPRVKHRALAISHRQRGSQPRR